MRQRSSVGRVVGLVGIGCLALPGGQAWAAPATSSAATLRCGSVVTTHVTLQSDLHCPGVALSVQGDVVLALAGHTVTGDIDQLSTFGSSTQIDGGTVRGNLVAAGSTPDAGVAVSLHHVSLRGSLKVAGAVTTTASDISGDIVAPSNNDPLYITLHGTTVAGTTSSTRSVVITASSTGQVNDFNGGIDIEGSSVAGVEGDLASLRLVNSAVGAGGVSVYKPFDVTLSGDTVTGAAAGLEYVEGASSSHVTGPSVTNTTFINNGVGLEISFALDIPGTRIEGDTFVHNATAGLQIGPGISGVNAAGSTISHNTFVRNGGPGLWIEPSTLSSGFRVANNVTTHNAGHGILAPGVTDGGGNSATGNGTQPQCVGVTCR